MADSAHKERHVQELAAPLRGYFQQSLEEALPARLQELLEQIKAQEIDA